MKKKVIIPTIALVAILGAFAFTTIPVSAQDSTYSSLVTKVAQRFGLKEADVQQVVDEVRKEKMATMKVNWESRLTQAVNDGKISESQKQALIAKHAEVHSQIQGLSNLSDEEKKTKLKEIFAELEKWAADNNFNLKQYGWHGLKGGFGRGKMFEHKVFN